MTRARSLAAVLSGALLAWSSEVCAQNHREVPIGGRTATMGGAATAAGNDSAMPYLNPAGLAGVPGDIFAVSATVYGYTRRSFKDFFFPSGTQPLLGYRIQSESFSTTSIGEMPSSVMYFRHLSAPEDRVQHKVGFSLVIPQARSVDLVASVSGKLTNVSGQALDTASMTQRYTMYYLGPTYAVGFGDRIRVGVSLYGVYRRAVITTTSTSETSILGGTATSTTSGQNAQLAEALAVTPIAGVQARVGDGLWVGLGAAVPGIPVTGRLRFTSESSGSTPNPTTGLPQDSAVTSTAELRYSYAPPLRLNAGIALDRRDAASFAIDVHVYLPTVTAKADGVQTFSARRSGEVSRRYSSPVSFDTHLGSVVDVSAGGELALGRIFALRAGAFTDAAATPEVGTTLDSIHQIRLTRYGGTLGLGLKLGSFDTTTGLVLARGEGQYGAADPWITGGVVPVRTTETSALVVLSGAVTTEEAKKAIREAIPIEVPALPDLGEPSAAGRIAPRIPAPLPAEPKPPPPRLREPSAPPTPPTPPTQPAPEVPP